MGIGGATNSAGQRFSSASHQFSSTGQPFVDLGLLRLQVKYFISDPDEQRLTRLYVVGSGSRTGGTVRL
jgi:hypothetical protein